MSVGWQHGPCDLLSCRVSRGGLGHVPEKLNDFSDKDMLHFFDFERVLIDRMIPSDRNAL
jgi:hypothetical protein